MCDSYIVEPNAAIVDALEPYFAPIVLDTDAAAHFPFGGANGHQEGMHTVLLTFEDAGFCKKGEGGAFIEERDLRYDGDFPCNTHGGQLGCGQAGLAGGLSHVTESVLQLQGRAGERQVEGADVAYVNGTGGMMAEQVALILEGA